MKQDRTARLLRLQLLLWQHPEGMELKNITEIFSVNIRTVYRDFDTLEKELGIPVWQQGRKRGIMEGYFLPPITFTMAEAMILFFTTRLMYNHVHLYNPDLISLIMQLGSIVPAPLKKQIQNTIDHIEKLPRNDSKFSNFNKLTHAWLFQHPVKINYQDFPDKEPVEYKLDPYYIEPNTTGHFTYLIGYSHLEKAIRQFRVDSITGDVSVDESSTFNTPAEFDIKDYICFGWGLGDSKRGEMIKLMFKPAVNKSLIQTIWHPSQKVEKNADGSWTMTLRVQPNQDFLTWLKSLGSDVEVMEPPEVRQIMTDHLRVMTEMYSGNQRQKFEPDNTILMSHIKTDLTKLTENELSKKEKIQILRHEILEQGKSIRSVAKYMGISRNTAKKYLENPFPVSYKRKSRTRPVLEKVSPRLEEIIKIDRDREKVKQPSGSRLHRQLVQEGYKVGVTTVREYLRKIKMDPKENF